ncbi:glycosyltransferase family 39 protein [Tardiphaga sp. 768_D3_N2_1]|uniref:glycosyltransferase family 39 protein n=1 Tax=Tardiphaga sp. 768_D3_N2_1 TaxID=3240783 RepID=UPI003F8948E8
MYETFADQNGPDANASSFYRSCPKLRRLLAHLRRVDIYDIATLLVLGALLFLAFYTFKSYAISNDEAVQHRYGELILDYYRSGFKDVSVFHFENLFLYGGLFDIVAVWLAKFLPLDAYDLRHILCALIGIVGIGTTAATARLIADPRAGFLAGASLALCGAWYGGMFNHTKDIPLATAMAGATYFLILMTRDLPRPKLRHVLAFGMVTGAALGMRVLALLLVIYAGFAILLYLPRPIAGHIRARCGFIMRSSLSLLPALVIAYVAMIAAWPWAALAPLNPIRGLLDFSEFQYHIRTLLAGQVYEMATVPRLYVPIYILVRVPLVTLIGAILAFAFMCIPHRIGWLALGKVDRREIAIIGLAVAFPLGCQVICHGPAFTGMRHFLFVIPAIAILAGIGLHLTIASLRKRQHVLAAGALATVVGWQCWNLKLLAELHPYEYLFYNQTVGGLHGASGRYATDYWVNIMPAAVAELEEYLARTEHSDSKHIPHRYTVAVCGDRIAFEKRPHQRLQWIRMQQWDHADFFIAPTHMNCDRILDGKEIVAIRRLGTTIGVVKDRRALTQPVIASAP